MGTVAIMAQGVLFHSPLISFSSCTLSKMAPAMKAMKAMKGATSITKTELYAALETKSSVKKSDGKKVLESLAEVAAKEVKKGKFTIPGVVMVKTRMKPATKAGKREVFGKMMMVKAKPAKTIVKAFCVAALKKAV